MYKFVKRFFDVLLSLIALICLLPIMIPICIVLLLTGEHYVFYFQKRIGFKNKTFDIWKFATMLKNSPNMGTGMLTSRKDPRVLPFGRFLRKTKLNELPQLINILKGDMSIVGPRPMVDKTFAAYHEEVRKIIYDSPPGLTGIGSIVFRDEERYVSSVKDPVAFFNKVIQPHKGELEIWYRDNRSLRVDVLIIFLTAWAILFPENNAVYKIFGNLPRKDIAGEAKKFERNGGKQRYARDCIIKAHG
jgi:lipopolysaccharide/colanic/teichoic acid biosynthesis glycosyltransferase